MFSIRFPFNFSSPYKSASIIDYWSRWHSTLTRFLTAYLYNPISLRISSARLERGKPVSKRGAKTITGFLEMVATPTLTTFVIAGIWHGAGVQYVIFGILHGVYLTSNQGWRLWVSENPKRKNLIPYPVAVGLTLAAVIVGQIFFRAANMHDALSAFEGMFGLHGGVSLADGPGVRMVPYPSSALLNPIKSVAALALCFGIVWFLPNTQQILGQTSDRESNAMAAMAWLRWRPGLLAAAITIGLFSGCYVLLNASTSFLYFQF